MPLIFCIPNWAQGDDSQLSEAHIFWKESLDLDLVVYSNAGSEIKFPLGPTAKSQEKRKYIACNKAKTGALNWKSQKSVVDLNLVMDLGWQISPLYGGLKEVFKCQDFEFKTGTSWMFHS